MTWATQFYEEDGTILAVACDKLFDEQDYIRDWALFSELAAQSRASGQKLTRQLPQAKP